MSRIYHESPHFLIIRYFKYTPYDVVIVYVTEQRNVNVQRHFSDSYNNYQNNYR